MTAQITAKTFNKALNDAIKSTMSQRDKWQTLLDFSFAMALAERPDLGFLLRTYLGAKETRSLDHLRMMRYICASLPVTFRDSAKNKDKPEEATKPSSFIKIKDKDWVLTDNGKWYDYEAVKRTKGSKPIDLNKSLGRVVDSLTDAWNTDTPVSVDKKALREQLQAIQSLLTKIEERERDHAIAEARKLIGETKTTPKPRKTPAPKPIKTAETVAA